MLSIFLFKEPFSLDINILVHIININTHTTLFFCALQSKQFPNGCASDCLSIYNIN